MVDQGPGNDGDESWGWVDEGVWRDERKAASITLGIFMNHKQCGGIEITVWEPDCCVCVKMKRVF